MSDKVIPVKVALRCRPLIQKEIDEGCGQCLNFIKDAQQVILGNNKAFTYDYVYSPTSPQSDVYENSVQQLVKGIFKGYNATVLAYGQTGSGKTYTMGGGYGMFKPDADEEIKGVIPRVITDIFEQIQEKDDFEFAVKVSYLEIYKEDLLDLLVPQAKREENPVSIREDVNGGIKLQGLSERQVGSAEELLGCLEEGSHGRTVGATAMNQSSSRSHAIFTIHIERTSKNDSNDFCKAKFHLVDLAGSERAKKTQAEGNRFREGVNINKGLLALGNVISALGDEAQKRTHIPYRDSKLTRLLQDSLGGNSHTVMIACISPADSNMEETLSTLRYADRARKIKNKPVVNRDPQAAEILRLKQLVQDLQVQLVESGKGFKSMSHPVAINTSTTYFNCDDLKKENKALKDEIENLTLKLQCAVDENATILEKAIAKEMEYECLKQKLERLKEKTGLNVSRLDDTTFVKPEEEIDESGDSVPHSDAPKAAVHPYDMIRELHSQLCEIDMMADDHEFLSTIKEESEVRTSQGSGPELEDSVVSSPASQAAAAQAHIQRRADLNRDLAELNSKLENAQKFKEQLMEGTNSMASIKEKYEADMANLQKEIDKLQEEKEQLSSELESSKTNSALSKIAENRRQKLQQCEAQLAEYRAKLKEHGKLLRMKEQNDQQVTRLNSEIQAMKQQRVKMYKQLKEDNANFQKFKQAKDKEVMQLKAKERKHKAEIAKMERQSERQQSVLKRKAEEAAAANRRLKEALGRQKLAQEERNKKQETSEAGGIGNRVRKWLSHDLEVAVSVEEVRRHKKQFIDDRRDLTHQLNELKKRLEDIEGPPSAKKKMLNDSSSKSVETEESKELKAEIKSLEREVELRTAQINDLQQKLIDVDQDEKNKSRFNSVHTLTEAKCGLKYLMTQAVDAKADLANLRSEMEEMKATIEDMKKDQDVSKDELRAYGQKKEQELMALQREHENKVVYLLKQLKESSRGNHKNTTEEDMKTTTKLQEDELAKLSALQEHVQKLEEENNELKKELTKATFNVTLGRDSPLMPNFDEKVDQAALNRKKSPYEPSPGHGASYFSRVFNKDIQQPVSDDDTPSSYKPLSARPATRSGQKQQPLEEEEDEEDYEDIDDFEDDMMEEKHKRWEDDPDWKSGRTPGNTRTKAILAPKKAPIKKITASCSSDTSPAKPSCSCKGGCRDKKCGCRRLAQSCSDYCKCSSKCVNKEFQTPVSTTDDDSIQTENDSQNTLLNTTFTAEASSAESSLDSGSALQENKARTSEGHLKRKSGTTGEENRPVDVESDGVKNKKRRIYKQSHNFFGPP